MIVDWCYHVVVHSRREQRDRTVKKRVEVCLCIMSDVHELIVIGGVEVLLEEIQIGECKGSLVGIGEVERAVCAESF